MKNLMNFKYIIKESPVLIMDAVTWSSEDYALASTQVFVRKRLAFYYHDSDIFDHVSKILLINYPEIIIL